ncbi:regulator of G-protein signaling 22-like isoform X2 [Scyliorhinus canicula]|uniref:regulator of G-protein signaling 22-like isoform X2 n=1 Tax=Scyliorhinus canicula TaxID=7830 RepID=UPI0018F72BA0|nr:regulator of G-protein signaling 22-like isoform X2 [Scyliorhinus canicula]
MEQGNRHAGRLTTEPPDVTADDFEEYLLTDNLMVDYFNMFLSLLNFPMPIWFNKEMETFEVVDNAKENLLRQLQSLVYAYSPADPIYNATAKNKEMYPQFRKQITALDLKFENKFTVQCLDQVQAIAWIKNERLPTFLMSDCYFEYRLAKLLSQLECKTGFGMPQIDPAYNPWVLEKEESMSNIVETVEDTTEEIHASFEEGSDLLSMHSEDVITQAEELLSETAQETSMENLSSEDDGTFSIKESQQPSATSATSVKPGESFSPGSSVVDEVMLDTEIEKELNQRSIQQPDQEKVEGAQQSSTHGVSKPLMVGEEIFEFVPEYPLLEQEIIFLGEKPENKVGQDPKVSKTSTRAKEVRIDDKARKHEEQVTTGDIAAAQIAETSKPDEMNLPLDSGLNVDLHTASLSSVSQTSQSSAAQTPAFSDSKGVESAESDTSNGARDISDVCYVAPRHSYNFGSQRGIERFKKFLQGTAGEKYWWLWVDVERLKVIKDGKKRQSYLNKVRNRYLFNGGEYCMNAETRTKLCLSFVSQWTVETLCRIQSDIVTPLLLYWGPRYCINQGFPIRSAGIVLKDWEDRQLRPISDVRPFAMIRPILAKAECIPKEKQPKKVCKPRQRQRKVPQNKRSPKKGCTGTGSCTALHKQEAKEELPSSIDDIWSQASKAMKDLEDLELRKAKDLRNLETLMQIKKYHEDLCDSKIDDLLQALHNESRTGFYFTHFCEKTRNVLWNNGVNLWFDLKEYQRLFYAEIFQPFKLKRQAQFIFATYTIEGAPEDVQIDAENKKAIYNKLEPPFEELFDQLEEHTLLLLLVPWIQMMEAEMAIYRKVKLSTKSRYLDSKYLKKLRELQRKILPYDEFALLLHSASQGDISEDPRSAWQTVPAQFHNYTFNSILHNRLELDQFQMFLRENLADVDLNCWLDIDQYLTIHYNDKKSKDSKSNEIVSKYLGRKYFLGPSSPATKEQQEEVVALAGGRARLAKDQLSTEVALEVQRYAKDRLESKWLPMFLSTPQFTADHHIRIKLQEVVEDQMLHKGRKKRDVMKHIDSKWTASSKEIIAFRKALLNPVTALLFRKYVTSKGELMENNVIFWLEVQKYKDLCHSHASEETIQNKISVIINCFIHSNIPPTVQIDIPPEYAHTIINHREEQGPYIFREAQMAVFDTLFKLWPEFSDFRRRLALESLLPDLEEKSTKDQELMQSKSTLKTVLKIEVGKSEPAKQLHSLDIGSRSSGSQLSLKGGSDKPTPDQSETKAGSAGSVQDSKQSQKLSWSFSKYIEALNREEALIMRAHDVDRREDHKHESRKHITDSMTSAPINIIPPDTPNNQNVPNDLNMN